MRKRFHSRLPLHLRTGVLRRTAACLFLCSVFARAASYGGDWGNTFYLVSDQLDSSRPAVRAYENLNLHVRKLAGSDISVFSNLNFSNGLLDPQQKRLEIDHFYLDWENIAQRFAIRVGRQRQYESIDPVYIDGMRVYGNFWQNRLRIMAYGGARVPPRFSDRYLFIDADSNQVDAGIRAGLTAGDFTAGIAYHHDYSLELGTDAGLDIGLDGSWQRGERVYLDGRMVYNLLDNVIDSYDLSSSFQLVEKVALSMRAFGDRRLSDTISVFARTIEQGFDEGEIEASYHVSASSQARCGYTIRSYENDSLSQTAGIRLHLNTFSVGARQEWGYGGQGTRADAGLRFWKTSLSEMHTSASFTRYVLSDAITRYAWVGGLAVNLQPPVSWWNARIEGQVLRNQFYDYDFRLLMTTHVRFSTFVP